VSVTSVAIVLILFWLVAGFVFMSIEVNECQGMEREFAMNQMVMVDIRFLIRRDMPEVLEIEQQFSDPWTEDDFTASLMIRNVIGVVAEAKGLVLGYMIYELHKREFRVVSIAVYPQMHRLGIATQLIDKLAGKLNENAREKILLTVRESNLAGQLFFKRMGFRCVAITHGDYDDTNDAAYHFEYLITALEKTTGTSRISKFV